MRRFNQQNIPVSFSILFLIYLCFLPVVSAGTKENFQAAVNEVVRKHSSSKTEWGVAIRKANGQSLYEKKSLRMLVPASNRKLFTSVLALDKMGPGYRYQTALIAGGEISERGHLRGDLIISGSGDPTFLNPNYHNGSITGTLEKWADRVKELGVKYIHRDIIVDCSSFVDDHFAVRNLPDDYLVSYSARASCIPFYENTIAVRMKPGPGPGHPARISLIPSGSGIPVNNLSKMGNRGSKNTLRIERPQDQDLITIEGTMPSGTEASSRRITIRNPSKVVGNILRQLLSERGIIVRGKVKVVYQKPQNAKSIIASYDSPPLAEILLRLNQNSNNFNAEQIYQSISRRAVGQGSYQKTRQIELEFLDRIAINPKYVQPEDGSGLSRANLCTADSLVRLLSWAQGQRWFAEFKNSLAVYGKKGTLRKRGGYKRLIGKIYGKTGTLNSVSCLSGYYITSNGTTYIYSILVNNCSTGSAIAAQGKILNELARYYGHT